MVCRAEESLFGPNVGSGGGEGMDGTMPEGRGKIAERGLRDLVSGGAEEGRIELGSELVVKFRAPLVVGAIGLSGRSEERGTSVVCTTP